MNRNSITEFVAMEEEIYTIASAIVADHYDKTVEKGSPLRYTADDVDFSPIDQDMVSIRIYISGKYGYTDGMMIHVEIDEFCDPKWLLSSVK